MIVFSVTAPLFDLPDVLFFTIPSMFAFALPPYFNAQGRLEFSRYYFAIVPLAFLLGVCIHNSPELGDKYLILTSATLPLILFKKRRTIYLLFALNVVAFFLVTIYQNMFQPLVIIPKSVQWIYSTFSVLTVFLIIFFILQYFRNDTEEYEEELESKNREISQKNHEIIDSITYARRLQQAILPPEEEIYNSLPDSFVFYKPKDIVAGDFYFAEQREDYFFVAAADCTGHGVPGAMMSLVCSNALNKAVSELGLIKPGEILDKVTEMVVGTFKKGQTDIKDGMDISLCVINTRTREIAWAGANNPLWYVSNEEFKEITANKQPVGMSEKYSSFTTHILKLAKGSLLYLFTDGFADQFGGPKGKKFKYKQLAELIFNNRMLSMTEQRNLLDETFNSWKGNIEQVDDVCIIGIKL
jgi:serine phosphatase RsbU (regulator of sigma subunit)